MVADRSNNRLQRFTLDGKAVDILGGATGLNYASDYVDAGGIMVARQRRVYAYEGDYQIVKDPVLVAIDMSQVTVSR